MSGVRTAIGRHGGAPPLSPGGSVTAGNSSGVNDGAAAVFVTAGRAGLGIGDVDRIAVLLEAA